MGPNGRLMGDLVPGFEFIMGEQPRPPDLPPKGRSTPFPACAPAIYWSIRTTQNIL